MGRPAATTDGTVHLRLDAKLKRRAVLFAMDHRMTVSELVAKALDAYMRQERNREPGR
jgi:predicted HicB family RNase H-like nuclease